MHSVSLMMETAARLLAALTPAQRAKATFPLDAEERMNWHYVPQERKGVPLRELSPYQKHLASALLSAGLSQTGYIKGVTIMSLEDVLRILEDDSGERRNPEKYYFSIFGVPSDTRPWGYMGRGPPFEPELYGGKRGRGRRAQLLRGEPGRGAAGAAQGIAHAGERGGPGAGDDPAAWTSSSARLPS